MNPAITTLAYAFFVLAVVLFAPGVAYLLFDWTRRVRKRYFRKPLATTSVENPDAILMLLDGFTKGLGAIGKVGGFIGEIVAGVLAGLALSAILVGLLLFFTARGLLDQQPWARWVAGILMANVLLLGMLSLLTSGKQRGKRLAISLLVAATSGAALYALWTGYSR